MHGTCVVHLCAAFIRWQVMDAHFTLTGDHHNPCMPLNMVDLVPCLLTSAHQMYGSQSMISFKGRLVSVSCGLCKYVFCVAAAAVWLLLQLLSNQVPVLVAIPIHNPRMLTGVDLDHCVLTSHCLVPIKRDALSP